MSTDQERAEELLHFISNEPKHGDAIAAIVKEFENVRGQAISAYAQAIASNRGLPSTSAFDEITKGSFDDEIAKHRTNIRKQLQRSVPTLSSLTELAEAVEFLLALVHQP